MCTDGSDSLKGHLPTEDAPFNHPTRFGLIMASKIGVQAELVERASTLRREWTLRVKIIWSTLLHRHRERAAGVLESVLMVASTVHNNTATPRWCDPPLKPARHDPLFTPIEKRGDKPSDGGRNNVWNLASEAPAPGPIAAITVANLTQLHMMVQEGELKYGWINQTLNVCLSHPKLAPRHQVGLSHIKKSYHTPWTYRARASLLWVIHDVFHTIPPLTCYDETHYSRTQLYTPPPDLIVVSPEGILGSGIINHDVIGVGSHTAVARNQGCGATIV